MIQDILPHIYHNEYHDIQPGEQDFILFFHKNKVLVRFQDEKLRYPTKQELHDFSFPFVYLFSIDERPYYLALSDNMEELSLPGYHYEDVRIFRTTRSQHTSFAGVTGHHLFCWYDHNRFCGRCGTSLVPDSRERMMYCPSCHNTIYPRISPAIIVAITNKNRLLMSKYANRPFTNYALIAGFTEIGECLEDTVHREVMEEVGLKVRNITYYKSQPWAFSESLLIGFFAELDGDDTILLDTSELKEAAWFTPSEIELEEDHISLTREMIMKFKNDHA